MANFVILSWMWLITASSAWKGSLKVIMIYQLWFNQMDNSVILSWMWLIAGEKCVGFTTIGLMESVWGNSMTMALLVEVEAFNVSMEGQYTHRNIQ